MEARPVELGAARDAAVATARAHAPVDWSAPWFDLIRPELGRVLDDASSGRFDACREQLDRLALARNLRNENGHPVRFADAGAIDARAYEAHVWSTGQVPTRCTGEGAWHDFFNALVWLALPCTKARLNRLQAGVIARDGVHGARGGLRDAATLFDENAVLLVTQDDTLLDALRGFDWQALFVAGRARFRERAHVTVFGHALLDKLRAPYKAVCGHAWIVRAAPCGVSQAGADADARAALDVQLSQALDAARLTSSAFSPLPVLGIPGWWAPNADPAFYRDAAVFRPGRRRRAQPPDRDTDPPARTSTGDL